MTTSTLPCPRLPIKTIDDAISRLYGVSTDDIERCERADDEGANYGRISSPIQLSPKQPAEALVSYLWGVAIGRWANFAD